MALAQTDPRQGNRTTTPVLTLSATNTTGVLYTLPTDGQSAIIRKLHWFSSDVAGCNLSIGQGTPHGSFVAALPKFAVIAGLDDFRTEDQLEAVEFFTTTAATPAVAITAEVDAHTSGSVTVIAEVELFPGSSVHA